MTLSRVFFRGKTVNLCNEELRRAIVLVVAFLIGFAPHTRTWEPLAKTVNYLNKEYLGGASDHLEVQLLFTGYCKSQNNAICGFKAEDACRDSREFLLGIK